MKKIISLLMAAALMFALGACAGGGETEDKAADVLRVGMECNYAPYNWSQPTDENNAIAISNVDNMFTNGYDVQVAKKIATSMGKTLEIYSYEWDSLIPAVQSGKLDMIIAGMSPTAERKEKIDFSNNYYISNLVVIAKKGNLEDVTTIADLDGKKIAAQSGTSHLEALESQTKAEVNELADFSTMLIALNAGTIDGYIAEEPTAMAVCADENYHYIPLVNNETGFNVPEEDVSIAVGVKKESALIDGINAALADLNADAQRELMALMVKLSPSDE